MQNIKNLDIQKNNWEIWKNVKKNGRKETKNKRLVTNL